MLTARSFLILAVGCLVLLATPSRADAQDAAPQFSTEQLEQLVAPIALYPDAVLTQLLMASTYPLEIVEADRWLARNPSLAGDALDKALLEEDWDASVKGLCHTPDVIKKMSENLDWTQDLGDAFLAQQQELMDTVQRMRGKAYDAGNLETTEQMVVTQQPDKIIVIESPSPEVVYVPTYSPTVVYGAWSYPTYYYPPMYVPPPPGYGLMTFGFGMAVGAAIWGDSHWGWGDTDIKIDVDRYNEFNRNTNINADRDRVSARGGDNRSSWQHNPSHRKGVNYGNQNVARQYGAREGQSRVSRDQTRGRSVPASAQTRAQAGSRARGATAMSGSRNAGFDRAASSRGSMSRGTSSFGGARAGGGGGRRR